MVAEAKRGFIYEYDDGRCEGKRYVLIISSNNRKTDRMVNTIMFGTSNLGHDVATIDREELGEAKYLHCGMITYTKREFLVAEVCELTSEELEQVEYLVCRELHLREDIVALKNFYQSMYYELLEKVVNTKTGE